MQTDAPIQELLSQRNFKEAERLIEEKLKKEPDSADAYYLQGVSAYFQGEMGKGVESLKKALSIDPKHTDSAICLSVLYNDIGRYDEAKNIFQTANQSVAQKQGAMDAGINRKFAVKHLELADLYFRYRRYDEAIEEYTKASELDPAVTDIRIRKAKAYAKKGFVTRAIQELQQLKDTHVDDLPVRIQLGLLHYSQGNVLDAELEWEGVLAMEPSHREALGYLKMAKESRSVRT